MTRAMAVPRALPVSAREQAQRRALLISIGALILLSVSPVFGHHLAQGAGTLLQGTDRIGEICLVALHLLLAPVHELFHLMLVAGLAYASWEGWRAWRRGHRLLTPLEAMSRPPDAEFLAAAADARLDPRTLRVVDGLPNPAFTVGWLWPRVYVAAQLAQCLTRDQLSAVLAHEGAHVARRDPLRLSVFRFFARTLFWIPALRRLADDAADDAEVQADDQAAGDRPLVLASAILSVAQWMPSGPRIAGTTGFTCHDMLERRVRRLAGEDIHVRTHVTWRSLAGAAAALVLLWTSGVIVAHPLHGQTTHAAVADGPHAGDCEHHEGLAILHLFCDGLAVGSAPAPCPHARS